MPRYDYKCPNGHQWELTHSMAECEKRHFCDTCRGKGQIQIPLIGLNNVTLTDKELKSLEFPFGKENMKGVKTVGDVDRVLSKINANYKWAGGFGR